jgi:hypothetical protein
VSFLKYIFTGIILVFVIGQLFLSGGADLKNLMIIDDFSAKGLNKVGGRTAVFVKKPSEIKLDWIKEDGENVLKIDFDKKKDGWCGLYTTLKDAEGNYFDAAEFKALVFKVKGLQGSEKFEVGLADRKWEEKEDSVKAGEIGDYLPQGITAEWQQVVIPLQDFERLRFNQLASLALNFTGAGKSTIKIKELAMTKEVGIVPKSIKVDTDVFVIENFESEEGNALGGSTAFFERSPSALQMERTEKGAFQGKSLKVYFKKDEFGWCGVYTPLKQKSRYLNIDPFRTLSFMVKGQHGGELFEIKMADRTWEKKGDAIRGGSINEFLKGGLTNRWQEVSVPLDYFGDLDFSEIASLVFNFSKEGEGTVYFDNITFKKEKIKL